MKPKWFTVLISSVLLAVVWTAGSQPLAAGKSDSVPGRSTPLTTFALDADASGVIHTINNIVNLTVSSRDANVLKAEYRAGFVQGHLQGKTILSARDNSWDHAYLLDPSHSFPAQPGPTPDELNRAAGILNANYQAFLQYVENPTTGMITSYRLKRLLFRMLGIYHGACLEQPEDLDFSGDWLPDADYFRPAELTLGYEVDDLSFMDVYFINAFCDFLDVLYFAPVSVFESAALGDRADRCSAFLKRAGGEVILAHNTWAGFLSQTMTQTLAVNDDLLTVNAYTPGLIGSATDFGYNNRGIMFNETTHRASRTEADPLGLWTFWRAALAEQFSGSIPEFFELISLDNTGSYLNGYMLVDAKNNETGLVEMSYRCFIYYRSTGGPYSVSSLSVDGGACSTDYDEEMVTPDYLMGINYPASLQVRSDLQSTDNRPARREQFRKLLPKVNNAATARRVITYTDQSNPLSIFGRWDLGYGDTDYPKQIPDGSLDAKVATSSMVRAFMNLSGVLETASPASGFWMLYGTPYLHGKPFVWSESQWSGQTLRDVPDRLDGHFTLMPIYLK